MLSAPYFTVNTEDPTVFGRTPSEKIVSLVADLGFTPAHAERRQANAFAVADMPAATRDAAMGEIDAPVRRSATGRA